MQLLTLEKATTTALPIIVFTPPNGHNGCTRFALGCSVIEVIFNHVIKAKGSSLIHAVDHPMYFDSEGT